MKTQNWKLKTLVAGLITILVSFLIYLALGRPVFTIEQAFRRETARNLLGTATILGTESIDCVHYGYNYNTLIVAETDHGSILYCTRLNHAEELYYRENNTDLTVMALPNGGMSWYYGEPRQLNVVLFDDYPNAVRAELEMLVNCDTPMPGIQYHYKLTAQRQNRGYFRFIHSVIRSENSLNTDNMAMKILTDITSMPHVDEFYYWECTIPTTVRLYDQNDNLIVEKTFELRSIGAEEWKKQHK